MIKLNRTYHSLDNLIIGLEQDILDMNDRELEAETELFFGRIQGVRDVIEDSLRSRVSIDQPSSDRGAAYDAPALPVPDGFSEKRKLLAELFAYRPGHPGQLQTAFSARKQLSNTEVEAIVERLIRLGILRRDNTTDDDP